jgi:hypothetical protein
MFRACRILAAAPFALSRPSGSDAATVVDTCSVNCGIEQCPEVVGAWCRAVGCFGDAFCASHVTNCGGDAGILCLPFDLPPALRNTDSGS